MEWLNTVLHAVQVIAALSIIGLVLLQQGKGSEMGSAFGAGSAGGVFGAAGAANFLSRMTKWAAVLFFAATGALAWVTYQPEPVVVEQSVMEGFDALIPGSVPNPVVPAPQVESDASVPSVPVVPAVPAE